MRRPAPPRDIPPPLELECLRALWKLGRGNARAVREALAPARSLAYTTVLTLLERLARRGMVERAKAGRSFVYVPAVERSSLRRAAVRELVETFFDGSEPALIAYLEDRRHQEREAPPAIAEDRLDTALL